MQYGSMPQNSAEQHALALLGVPDKLQFSRGSRLLTYRAILLSLFVPSSLFAAVSGVVSFSVHYNHPFLCWLLVGGGCALTIGVAAHARQALKKRGDSKQEPTWYPFLAVSMVAALLAGVALGSANYSNNIFPFHEISKLTYYPAVDPVQTSGTSIMDAGRVIFAEGSKIDETKTMMFKNKDNYCVAPIVTSNKSSTTYDMWAAGLNCCATDFHCGEYNNIYARGGLRLVRQDQESFYRLAVHQAEAKYMVQSPYPLFFEWVQDPEGELAGYKDDAFKYYVSGVCCFTASQIVATTLAMVAFHKMGIN